jgi:hypothetical protein
VSIFPVLSILKTTGENGKMFYRHHLACKAHFFENINIFIEYFFPQAEGDLFGSPKIYNYSQFPSREQREQVFRPII